MRGETLTRVKFSSFYGSSWIFDILILTDFLDHSASQFNFQKLFFRSARDSFFGWADPAHENFTESYDSRMLVGPREDLSNLKKNRTNPYRALTESCFQIFQFSKRIFHAHSHQRTERDKLEKKLNFVVSSWSREKMMPLKSLLQKSERDWNFTHHNSHPSIECR